MHQQINLGNTPFKDSLGYEFNKCNVVLQTSSYINPVIILNAPASRICFNEKEKKKKKKDVSEIEDSELRKR